MAAEVDVDNLIDWDEAADDYEQMMLEIYPDLVELAYRDSNRLLPVEVSFDLSNPAIQDLLDGLGTKIRGVSDTTRAEIQALVGRQADEGWSMQELAKAIREHGADMSLSRALTIARTETGTAYNMGATTAYREAGVEKVTVLDGDEDEDCASANGQVWTLEEAESNPLAHPNCTRVFTPLVEG